MKKQLKLLVAIMAVAVIGIMCLVGCTPNRPDKFLLKALESDELTLSMKMGDNESTVIYGKDKYAMKMSDGKETTESYLIKNGETYESYTKVGDTDWIYESITAAEFGEEIPKLSDALKQIPGANLSKEQLEQLDKTFNDAYVKEDGKWYVKNPLDGKKIDGFYFEIKGDTLNIVFSMEQLGVKSSMSLSIKLSGKVNLPSEAKAAKK